MKSITLTLLATAVIGGVAIGGASAMPFNNVSAALGASPVQEVRLVCDQYRRCYNTRRAYRSAYYAPRYYNRPAYYSGGPSYGYAAPGYGYYGRPGVGIGLGPFGVRVF